MRRFILFFLSLCLMLSGCTGKKQFEPHFEVEIKNEGIPDTPYSSGEIMQYFDDSTEHSLAAGENYGTLYPYHVTNMYSERYAYVGEQLMYQSKYGLCDADGKIICYPSYDKFITLEKDGAELLLLCTTKNTESNLHTPSPEISYTIAAPDGSWLFECDDMYYKNFPFFLYYSSYSYNERIQIEIDYLTVKKDGKWGVIGMDGEILLPFESDQPLLFNNGLAPVISDNEISYRYIDITGRIVTDSYEMSPFEDRGIGVTDRNYEVAFSFGLAPYYSNGKYGFINTKGEVAANADFVSVREFDGDFAIVTASRGNENLIDKNGQLMLPEDRNYFGIYRYYNSDYYELRSDDGLFVFRKIGDEWTMDENNQNKRVMANELTLKIENNKYILSDGKNSITFENDIADVTKIGENYLVWLSNMEYTWVFLSDELKEITRYTKVNGFIEKDKIIFSSNSSEGSKIVNFSGETLLETNNTIHVSYKNRYMVSDKKFTGLMDENGRWILKIKTGKED